MDAFFDAVAVFFERLAAVHWGALTVALLLHVLRLVTRVEAWSNILAAAFPHSPVRWRTAFSAYMAGVGVNAISPARAGDVVKAYLAHRGIEGASYATLASTLVVETLFDSVMG